MSTPAHQDELTATVYDAVHSLSQFRKANFLLDTALALIDAGQYVNLFVEFTVSHLLLGMAPK